MSRDDVGSIGHRRADFDVIVVGGGNAGFSAAHAARERGRSVVLLERGEADMAGGNSYYTAGAVRFAHGGLDDLRGIIEPDDRHTLTEVPPYSVEEYLADMRRVTDGRNDSVLTQVLAEESTDTVHWLQGLGLKYRLLYERQAYRRQDGTYLFWGGLHVGSVGGGAGLIAAHTEAAAMLGTKVHYGHAVTGLTQEHGQVVGITYSTPEGRQGELRAQSVILAAGGFEANPDLREMHLGPGWASAKVRGTPYNDGRLILAALDLGAARGGDWSTCHSVQWDAFTPGNASNRALTNRLTRGGYPLGVIVNREGQRFVDEGADFRNYTYAKYGRDILRQPGSIAFQVFDAPQRAMLRSEEYDMPGVSVEQADTIAELAGKIGVQPQAMTLTIQAFNESIDGSIPWNPTVKDGRTAHVDPPKSNWADPIDTAPFYAFPVTCGVTFTFGGLRGDTCGRVLNEAGEPISGLYTCGEMLGGLFSGNYPGGSGLAAGMVFGRRAGLVA